MKTALDKIYEQYNLPEFVHPDPLEVLYSYNELRDREIVALLASSLAYGNVKQILKSLAIVLGCLGQKPYGYLQTHSEDSINETFKGFKHRFTTDAELTALLIGIKRIAEVFGDLKTCFLSLYSPDHETVLPALSQFVEMLRSQMTDTPSASSLLPDLKKGSACKRLHLFMRWMVRCDEVDPGGWHDDISASKLIVPLDVHMHRICHTLKLTDLKQPSLRCALEVTEAFRRIIPQDPVRYDFSLTRFGIRKLCISLEDIFGKGVVRVV